MNTKIFETSSSTGIPRVTALRTYGHGILQRESIARFHCGHLGDILNSLLFWCDYIQITYLLLQFNIKNVRRPVDGQ